MARSDDASSIDTNWAALAVSINSYLADGGNPSTLTPWLISQLKQINPRIASYLIHSGSRAINQPPDFRSFSAADNFN